MDAGAYKIPNRRLDENLLLATWNIQQFSEKKSWRSLKYMADIIERFDLVAIQEIKSDLRGISKLQSILPGRYRLLVSDVTGNTERFAFIYDERTIESTGLAADNYNIFLPVEIGPLTIPLYARYHVGPMNTLSNYTLEQDAFGVGLKFRDLNDFIKK